MKAALIVVLITDLIAEKNVRRKLNIMQSMI